MKYKLINITTKQETLCDKVTIDGFDYYVSDEIIGEDELFVMGNELVYNSSLITDEWCKSSQPKPIATNNPNIDIPKVVDEVEILGEDETNIRILKHKTPSQIARQYFDGFVKGYNKSQETHPFSEEDMIEFGQWVSHNDWVYLPSKKYWVNEEQEELCQKISSEELLQLWKEQQPKT